MTTLIALLIGIMLGFLAEWVVDWLYGRRKVHALEGELNKLRKQKTIAESQLVALRDENEHLKEIYSAPLEEDREPSTEEAAVDAKTEQLVGVPEFIEETDEIDEHETEEEQKERELQEESEGEIEDSEKREADTKEKTTQSQPELTPRKSCSSAVLQPAAEQKSLLKRASANRCSWIGSINPNCIVSTVSA